MVRLRLALLVLLAAHVAPWVAPCLATAPGGHAAMACCRQSEPSAPAARPCCAASGQPPAAPVAQGSATIHPAAPTPLPAVMALALSVQRVSVPSSTLVPVLSHQRSTVLLI